MPFLDPAAPEGKIRIIGRECGREWLIGDFDAEMSIQEVREEVRKHAGVGIDIEVLNEEGEIVLSA